MPKNTRALHHHHKKKRIEENGSKLKRFMDRAIYFIGAVGPIMTIPQVMKIWVEQNAQGVSIISWSSYMFVEALWVVYGILHKEKPIIFTYTFWIFLDASIVLGVFLYG